MRNKILTFADRHIETFTKVTGFIVFMLMALGAITGNCSYFQAEGAAIGITIFVGIGLALLATIEMS